MVIDLMQRGRDREIERERERERERGRDRERIIFFSDALILKPQKQFDFCNSNFVVKLITRRYQMCENRLKILRNARRCIFVNGK